jgi:hypothetical protein
MAGLGGERIEGAVAEAVAGCRGFQKSLIAEKSGESQQAESAAGSLEDLAP